MDCFCGVLGPHGPFGVDALRWTLEAGGGLEDRGVGLLWGGGGGFGVLGGCEWLGAEVGIFKWKVEFHGVEWNLMERFQVELIKTSQNSNGEIPQV